MHITTLTVAMGKIAVPGTELPRAASILHENFSAVLTLYRVQLLSGHLLRMCRPPCNAALRGAETLLPMSGRLLKQSAALRTAISMNDSLGDGYRFC